MDNVSKKVRTLQNDLIQLRKASVALSNLKLKRRKREILESLDSINYEMSPSELLEVPVNVDFAVECPENDTIKLRNDLKKHFKLLQILTHKVDCPISQCIDKI